jgi:hypothetical protein
MTADTQTSLLFSLFFFFFFRFAFVTGGGAGRGEVAIEVPFAFGGGPKRSDRELDYFSYHYYYNTSPLQLMQVVVMEYLSCSGFFLASHVRTGFTWRGVGAGAGAQRTEGSSF